MNTLNTVAAKAQADSRSDLGTMMADCLAAAGPGATLPASQHVRLAWPGVPASALLGSLSVGLLLGLWWWLTAAGLIGPLYLPAPAAVLHKLHLAATRGFMDATLGQHLAASLQRIVLALLAAVALGVPLGLVMGVSAAARGLLDPLIEIYRPIPPLAYLPLIVIWFGIGELAKVLLIFFAVLAPIVIATTHGVRQAGANQIRAAQSLGANRWQLLRHVILPAALPDILTGIRIGLGAGWSTLIAAELVAATRGLGFMVQSASQFLATDMVVAGIVVIAAVACGLELGLRLLQKRLLPWHGRPH